MKWIFLIIVFTAASIIVTAQSAIADTCSHLTCANFTDLDKIADCKYALEQGFNREDEQEVLCALWNQEYGYEEYERPQYELNVDLKMDYKEIDNRRFLLAGKILAFGIFNYLLFSITKLSVVARWFGI